MTSSILGVETHLHRVILPSKPWTSGGLGAKTPNSARRKCGFSHKVRRSSSEFVGVRRSSSEFVGVRRDHGLTRFLD